MPSFSEKQRKFMGAELARKRERKKTKTGMSEKQLEDFASKSLVKSIGDFITRKGKVYLKPGQKPPKGQQVMRGKKGGMFYDTSGRQQAQASYDANSSKKQKASAAISRLSKYPRPLNSKMPLKWPSPQHEEVYNILSKFADKTIDDAIKEYGPGILRDFIDIDEMDYYVLWDEAFDEGNSKEIARYRELSSKIKNSGLDSDDISRIVFDNAAQKYWQMYQDAKEDDDY